MIEIQDVKDFCGRINTATEDEKADFARRMQAAHDGIITYDALLIRFPGMDKPSRQKLYKKLEAETFKYPGLVPSTHPLHPAYISLRNKLGHFRGIKWDAEGKIIRSKEALLARKGMLEAKKADNLNRNKNIEAELEVIKKELEA